MQPKKKQDNYTNYGVPITQNKNQMANENQRHTMKYTAPQKVVQKPQNKAYVQNQNVYNVVQPAGNNRKTYNPSQLKANPIENQILANELVDETYIIDNKTGQKIILQNTGNPKGNIGHNNNQLHNQQLRTKGNKNNKENDITNSAFQDLTLTIAPTSLPKDQKKKSHDIYYPEANPIIENLNQILFGAQDDDSDNNYLDPRKSATSMTVSSLANLPYEQYPNVEFSKQPFMNIAGYGFNSYNGKVKNYNEDRVKVIPQYQLKNSKNKVLNVSYFSVFDGHSGNKCSDFLRENMHNYILNSPFFPSNMIKAIKEAFNKAEETFKSMAYDSTKNILLDKSGSCALIMLIINNYLFSINLGDSRAIYSYDTGKYLYQITRDHKPNDEIERKRIESAGGKVFYANKVVRNGREIVLKEEDFGKNFSFPYRIEPGKIAVSIKILLF